MLESVKMFAKYFLHSWGVIVWTRSNLYLIFKLVFHLLFLQSSLVFAILIKILLKAIFILNILKNSKVDLLLDIPVVNIASPSLAIFFFLPFIYYPLILPFISFLDSMVSMIGILYKILECGNSPYDWFAPEYQPVLSNTKCSLGIPGGCNWGRMQNVILINLPPINNSCIRICFSFIIISLNEKFLHDDLVTLHRMSTSFSQLMFSFLKIESYDTSFVKTFSMNFCIEICSFMLRSILVDCNSIK